MEPLIRFLENVMMGTHHELRNRELHVDFPVAMAAKKPQSAMSSNPKCNSCTLDCTLGERVILNELAQNPDLTQAVLANRLGVSVRTVKARTVSLQEKGLLLRVGGKRSGHWEIPDVVRKELGR